MAESSAPTSTRPQKTHWKAADADDAGRRGKLTIDDKVVERLASRAALETAGIQRHSTGIDKLTGRDLPRVHVQISGGRVRANVEVAVLWPTPLPAVVAEVQANIAHSVTSWTDLAVDSVDVFVSTIVEPDDRPTRSRVQ